ncbi:MAG: hypothetical protein MK233_07270, partial [Candidatus Poseidoniales archaeon]|nr:hypothetical protein [Candidatus Poseidoniales archaeon]
MLLLTVGWSPLFSVLEGGAESDSSVPLEDSLLSEFTRMSSPAISPPSDLWWGRGDVPASVYV